MATRTGSRPASLIPGVSTVQGAARKVAKAVYPATPPKQGKLGFEYEAVNKAAEKHHINPVILWGVFGAETAHGSNVKTSSTGAKGAFQFEPETAKAYNYPYTNAQTKPIFEAQANSAAAYLAALLPGGKGETSAMKGTGWEAAWEKALKQYSGGGYGLAHVKAEAGNPAQISGTEFANTEEANKTESEPKEEGLWAQITRFGVTLVGLLLGAALVYYGIVTMLKKPAEQPA